MELRAMIGQYKLTSVVINEMKTTSIKAIQEAWPGAAIEEIPALRREWGGAPRAGIAIAIQPGIRYALKLVFNEEDEETNSTTPALAIEISLHVRLTGTYISPSMPRQALIQFLSVTIMEGSGRDCILGYMNARDSTWDTMTNRRGRALRWRVAGTQYRVLAPIQPTYHARGRWGSSTPDLAFINMKGGTMEEVRSGVWKGASYHTPTVMEINLEGEQRDRGARRRTSKTSLNNLLKQKQVGKIYREKLPGIIEKLRRATPNIAQDIYTEATNDVIRTWQSFEKR